MYGLPASSHYSLRIQRARIFRFETQLSSRPEVAAAAAPAVSPGGDTQAAVRKTSFPLLYELQVRTYFANLHELTNSLRTFYEQLLFEITKSAKLDVVTQHERFSAESEI